jgi:hypothetical protein
MHRLLIVVLMLAGCSDSPSTRPDAAQADLSKDLTLDLVGDLNPLGDGAALDALSDSGALDQTIPIDLITPDAACGAKPLWSADHETGDLSQYTAGSTYGGSFDSDCVRPSKGVVTTPAFKGTYAMKMTAPISKASPACRQFRYEESSLGHSSTAHTKANPLYYSVWLHFPAAYTVADWTNVIQFKSKTYAKDKNDAFWVLELRNRADSGGKPSMYFVLRYKGLYPGPHKGGSTGLQLYHHKLLDVTLKPGQWHNVQVYLKQSTNAPGQASGYDGQLTVWQDGKQLYDMSAIATRYPDSWNEWSVNVYTKTNGVTVSGKPADFSVYVDDVKIAKAYIACH